MKPAPTSLILALLLSIPLAVLRPASAATVVWSGADSAVTTNWSDGLNWFGNLAPGAVDTAVLGTNGMSTGPGSGQVDNIVSASTTVGALMYAPTNGFRNTFIAPGSTLTISNTTVTSSLLSGTQTDAGGDTTVYNTVIGTGAALVLNSTNVGSAILIQQSSGTAGAHRSTVDLSALDTFNATVGRILIGVQGPLNAVAGQVPIPNTVRPAGTLIMARTNIVRTTQTGLIVGGQDGGNGSGQGGAASISGPAIVLGDGASNGGQGVVQLGQTNALFTDTICVGRQKSVGNTLSFNPAFASPTLFLRGVTSNRVMRLAVADDGNLSTSTTGASAVIGSVDLSFGTSDLMLDTLVLANGQTGNGTAPITGTFTLGAGVMDVNTVNVGYQNSANAAEVTQGTLNVTAGGNLVVHNQIVLGRSLGGSVAPQGTLVIDSASTVTVSNGIVDQSGSATSSINLTGSTITTGTIGTPSAPIGSLSLGDSTLNLAVNGSAAPVVTLHLGTGSSTNNTINVTAISAIAGLASKITLIQSATPLAGTFDFVLGTLPAGYTGTLQMNASGTEVQLVLTTSPFVAKTWTGGDLAPNHNTNWSDGLNWSGGVIPDATTPAFFTLAGSVGASALSSPGGGLAAVLPARLNNIVNSNFTLPALTYGNTNGTFQNTAITNGVTLTVALGSLTVGSPDTDSGNTLGAATISGAGSLNVNNSNAVVYVGLGSASMNSTAQATLDLSGLASFNASSGNFLVGVGGNSSGLGSVLQTVGTLYLGQTNLLTATSAGSGANDFTQVAFEVGDAGDAQTSAGYFNSIPSSIYLGRTNAIFADYVTIGRQWGYGRLLFNPAFANSSAYFRGASALAINTWNIGDAVQNTLASGGGAGTNDFTGGTVDLLVNTMNVGKSSPTSMTGSATTGSLTFNAGIINANTLNVSYNPPASDLSGLCYDYAVGQVNVKGTGTLTVNGTLNLAPTLGIPVGGTPTASLNINGGTVLANQIVPGTNSALSTVNVQNGTLVLTNGISAATPLSALNLTNATVTLPVTASAALNVGAVTFDGSAATTNKISVLSLPAIEVYPLTFTVLQSSAPLVFGGGVFNVKIGSLPPASPPYTASVSTNPAGTALVLTVTGGPITVRGNVFWVGPDNGNINWSDGANWLLPPVPGVLDSAYFNNTGMSFSPGAGSVDNIVDANITVAGLTFAETNGYHNTVINPGVTLTVSNPAVVIPLLSGTQTDAGAAAQNYNTISGDGSLVINATNQGSAIVVQQCSANSGTPQHLSTLDLSALGRFNATVGRLLVGVQGFTNTVGQVALPNITRPSSLLILAKTNIIRTTQIGPIQGPIDPANGNGAGSASISGPAIVISDGFGTPQSDIVQLGQTNAIFTDSIVVGRQKAIGTLMFNPALVAPSLFLRGSSFNRVATYYVTDDSHVSTSTTAASATNDLSLGTVDAMVDTLVVAKGESGTGSATVIGVFNLGAGTFNANSIVLGQCAVANAGGNVIGMLNVTSGGALIANNQIVLGQWLGAPSLQTRPSGILNVRDSSVSAGAIFSGGGVTNSIGLTNSTLNLTSVAGSIGTLSAPINNLGLTNSALNLAVGAFPPVVVSNLTISGSPNTITVTALPPIGSVPSTNTLIQSVKPIVGAYNFVLGPLPPGYSGTLQTNAAYTAIQLRITAAPFPPTGATITGIALQSGTNVVISGTNGVGGSAFYVLSSTNLLAPLQTWSPVATNTFNGSGSFTVIVPTAPSDRQRFYAIQSQ
jgi:hypothetical protein